MMGTPAITDHDKIRKWIEARGGHPARMKSGLVGVDFSRQESSVENISWDEFFRVFDASRDTFLHHDTNATRH
ncbi:hypothetical protein [Rhizobium sp. 768_B6_N1_8]|uniref:hypothetical protein n=1 Tax=unclassified Rhizobium TaxID=2613769 RepID=UPI003F230710